MTAALLIKEFNMGQATILQNIGFKIDRRPYLQNWTFYLSFLIVFSHHIRLQLPQY